MVKRFQTNGQEFREKGENRGRFAQYYKKSVSKIIKNACVRSFLQFFPFSLRSAEFAIRLNWSFMGIHVAPQAKKIHGHSCEKEKTKETTWTTFFFAYPQECTLKKRS